MLASGSPAQFFNRADGFCEVQGASSVVPASIGISAGWRNVEEVCIQGKLDIKEKLRLVYGEKKPH